MDQTKLNPEALAALESSKPHETADGRSVKPQILTEDFADLGILPAIAAAPAPFINLGFRDVSSIGGYRTLYYNKTRRRLEQKDAVSARVQIDEYVGKLRSLNSLRPLLSSYDKKVILPLTCGLGVITPGHFDLDEKGQFGRFGKDRTFLFPTDVADALVSHLAALLRLPDDRSESTLSMKRGTNLGWPTQKGGRTRSEGDCLLALHCAYAIGAQKQGATLDQAMRNLESQHGEAYAVAGERLQHTERLIPWMGSNFSWQGWNLQPRVRGIYFSPKFCVAWNRPPVKRLLHALLRSPNHIQDKDAIKARTDQWIKDKWLTTSVDVGRFDHSFGGDAGRQAIRIAARALATTGQFSEDRVFADWNTEFSIPDLIATNHSVYQTNGGEILSSGTSMTSIVNTLCSHMIIYELVRYCCPDVDSSRWDELRGVAWDGMSWGDDVMFAVNPRHPAVKSSLKKDGSLQEALDQAGEKMQLKLDVEPTLKWLGTNYHMPDFPDATLGLPLGRFIQQQIFPERNKIFPVDLIGLAARLLLLDGSVRKEAFTVALTFLGESKDKFEATFRERLDSPEAIFRHLTDFQSMVAEDAKLSQAADEVLQIFAKGTDPGDIPLTGGFEIFESLLGVTSVDVSDPTKFLRDEHGQDLPAQVIIQIRELQEGKLSGWRDALTQLAWYFGGNFVRPGDCYY